MVCGKVWFRSRKKIVPIYLSDSPPKPKITRVEELPEGTPVSLKCTAAGPCSSRLPVLSWSPTHGKAVSELLENSDKTKSVLSVLTFTPQHRLHHGTKVFCNAEYTLLNERKIMVFDEITLNVLRKKSVMDSDTDLR